MVTQFIDHGMELDVYGVRSVLDTIYASKVNFPVTAKTDLINVLGGPGNILKLHKKGDPISSDELAEIIKQVTGKTGKFGWMGSGDLPYIVNSKWGATEFGLGVACPECNYHGRNEFVYQKDIEDLAEIISRFLSPD